MENNNQLIEIALSVALQAHAGQLDKGGNAYILHPLRLMQRAETLAEKVVALLHDVVEDSDYSFVDLREAGFPPIIVGAVEALTKNSNEKYEQFIERVKSNNIARKIKILDIIDNMDITRLSILSGKDFERLKKYQIALLALRG